ncbi:MAG: hypothetical protein WA364_16120 [Candidatus Nitrosopolaris sp.]
MRVKVSPSSKLLVLVSIHKAAVHRLIPTWYLLRNEVYVETFVYASRESHMSPTLNGVKGTLGLISDGMYGMTGFGGLLFKTA